MESYAEIQKYIRSKTGLSELELVSMTNLATEHKEQSLWWSVLNGYAEEGFGKLWNDEINDLAKHGARLMLKRIEQGWVKGKLWPEIKGEVGYRGIKAELAMLYLAKNATQIGVNASLGAVFKILLGRNWQAKYKKMRKSSG